VRADEGARREDREPTVDGKLIRSRNPDDLPDLEDARVGTRESMPREQHATAAVR
jgi:hypothetical protein